MAKKKKTDYRFGRVKHVKASNQPRVPVDPNGRVLSDNPEHLPLNYLFAEKGPAPHTTVSNMGEPEVYKHPSGDLDWVSFVGADTIHQVPSNAAVIVINGNSKTYPPERYKRFKAVLFVTINSSGFTDEWINSSVTHETARDIMAFHEQHLESPIVVQCSAGEQRSAAVAEFLGMETDRSLVLDAPGCKGTLSFADRGVVRALRRKKDHVLAEDTPE